jgi:uncharacterized membrane protein
LIVQASIYATLLVAFFLRAYRLADQNVWWDEGWSIWLSQKDILWIALRTAADEHPPLHYWMLHVWNFVAGTDAFAGRFLSLAFGVLTIALIYRIGKRVGGAWVGVLAALFLATARFHIWWSQDIKNYTPSIFFAFAAVWFALQVLAISDQQSAVSPSPLAPRSSPLALRNSLLAYALFAALALWTHYLAALVLLALNVYALGVIASRWLTADRRPPTVAPLRSCFPASLLFRDWLIANALAAALFAPWLYLYLQNASAWTAAPAFDFVLFLKLVATVLPLGVTTNIDNYAALTIAFTALAALPIFSMLYSVFRPRQLKTENWTRNTESCLLFTLIVALPPILIYALSLTPVSFFAPKIQARYLLVLLPAYVMVLALGIQFLARLARPLAVFVFLTLLTANVYVLNDYYADRRLRDDYATLANTINAFARQGDLILLDTDQEWPTFLYYLRAPLDWLGAPNGKTITPDDADALARRALTRHNAIWLVAIPDALATDPQKLLEARIARDLSKQYERAIGDKRLVLYAPAPRDFVNVAPEKFAPQVARAEKVNDTLQLLGFDLPVRELSAGDTLRLVTYWRATYPAMTAVRVGGLITTTLQMPSGALLRYENDFAIPPTASGEFPIQVNQIELARVRIAPRGDRTRFGEIAHRVDDRLGNAIHLIGYDLPRTTFRAGENLPLTLYWRADRQIEKSYTVFAQIVGEQFNPKQNNPLWGQVDRASQTPTNAWLIGEIVSDTCRISIDADAPAGKYKIIVGMYDAATGARLPTDGGDSIILGEIEIRP